MRPAAQQDDGDAEIAAGSVMPRQPLRALRGRGRRPAPPRRAAARLAGPAGPGAPDDHGFDLVERRVQRGRHHDAADGRVSLLPGGAGQEPGGVVGGDDDLGLACRLAAGRPGQQVGQDGPGGGWCPRAGQAEAAEGGGVGGDLLAVADADGYRAGPGRGRCRAGRAAARTRAGRGGSGGPGFAGAGDGLPVRLVQVQVQVRVVQVRAGVVWPGQSGRRGGRAARSRAEMTGGGGPAGSRLEVSTAPGR